MEFASVFVAMFLGVFSAGAFVGYHFRDLVGKEVKKFGEMLHAEIQKAHEAEQELNKKYFS